MPAKFALLKGKIADVVEQACADAQELSDECREICDNMPDSLQSTDRYTSFDNSATELDGLEAPDAPDSVKDDEIEYSVETPRRKNRPVSRASRCENVKSALTAVADYIDDIDWEKRLEESEDKTRVENDNPEDVDPAPDVEGMKKEASDYADEVRELADKIDGLEFPGMFG